MPKVLNLVPLSSGTTSAIRTTLIISAAYWEASENYGPYPNKPGDQENDGSLDPGLDNIDIGLEDLSGMRIEQGAWEDTLTGKGHPYSVTPSANDIAVGMDKVVEGYDLGTKKPSFKPPPWKPGAKKLESFDSGKQEE